MKTPNCYSIKEMDFAFTNTYCFRFENHTFLSHFISRELNALRAELESFALNQ